MGKKRKFIAVIATAAVLLAAVVIVIITTRNTKADEGHSYKENVAAKKNIKIGERELQYVELTGVDAEWYSDFNVYRDENVYYYFKKNTNSLWSIVDKSDDAMITFADEGAMIENAKKIVDEWIYGNEDKNFKWDCKDGGSGFKTVSMYQLVNVADEEIELWVAGVDYDSKGNFHQAVFAFDSIVDEKKVDHIVTEQEAVEMATEYISRNYADFEWSNIKTETMSGRDGMYWSVGFIDNSGAWSKGYYVRVDIFTGEATYLDEVK